MMGPISRMNSHRVCAETAFSQCEINAELQRELSLLIIALKDHDPQIRYLAAGVLGKIGVASVQVMYALSFIARKDAEPEIRRIAMESLITLQGQHSR